MNKSNAATMMFLSPRPRWFVWLVFELRLTVSWLWLAPVVSIGGIVFILSRSSILVSSYPFLVLALLEITSPILGVFLVVPLLSREWEQGTLMQLALQKPLFEVLLLRLCLCMLYLTSLVIGAVFICLSWCASDSRNAIQWGASVVLVTMAPTLLLAAFALVMTHITCSASSGYLLGVGYWLANLSVEIWSRLSILRPFLLFNWTFPPLSGQIDWVDGKIFLCIASIILLAMQVPLLTHEARLMQNKWE